MHFPTDKCTFLQEKKEEHFPTEKAVFFGGGGAHGRKLQEIAGGFQGQDSRTLANFHKNFSDAWSEKDLVVMTTLPIAGDYPHSCQIVPEPHLWRLASTDHVETRHAFRHSGRQRPTLVLIRCT